MIICQKLEGRAKAEYSKRIEAVSNRCSLEHANNQLEINKSIDQQEQMKMGLDIMIVQ